MLAFKHLRKNTLCILDHYFREIFQKLKIVGIICKLKETDQNVLAYTYTIPPNYIYIIIILKNEDKHV